MNFEPLTAEHVVKMGPLIPIHNDYPLTAELAVELESLGGWAAIEDGEVIAIAGIMPRWSGVGLGWAWLSRKWRKHAKAITKRVQEGLDNSDYHRIEIGVKCSYNNGHKWAERLGFEVEVPKARKWGPDGEDYTLYVRCK